MPPLPLRAIEVREGVETAPSQDPAACGGLHDSHKQAARTAELTRAAVLRRLKT
jgi:hypothetical protein